MPTTNRAPAVVYQDTSPTDARLVARAMRLHEEFMKARPRGSAPTRTDVIRDRDNGDAEVRMYNENDALVARYRWDSESDNMHKVANNN
jgi:hypothetical protein